MPGICGIANRLGGADGFGALALMTRRMKHYDWYQEDRHVDEAAGVALGRVSLGIVNAERQPAMNEDESLLAVMAGEFYDYEEWHARLVAAGHEFRTASHAELLLHGYEAMGRDFFRQIQGTFVAAIWDRANRRLMVVNDRFGMKPVYYAKLTDRLLVASEIKALLTDPEVSANTDLKGLAQFFTYGHLFGESTLLEGVRLLPPAGWLVYDIEQDRMTVERYWRLVSVVGSANVSETDHLDRIADAFDRAVHRRTVDTQGLGLSLSGGLDSRTILAATDRDRPITTVCSGMAGSIDHACAEQMARIVGCRHYPHVLDEGFLGDYGRHINHMVHLTDGHYLSQCIVMPTLPLYRELGIQVLLRGHAGELMHMSKAYNYSLNAEALGITDEAGLQGWLGRHLPTFMLDGTDAGLFAVGRPGEMADLAAASLRESLEESRGVEPALHRIWHTFIHERLRRETAMSMVEFGSLMETRLPFMDSELIEALMAAPPGMKLGDRIQAHILRRRLPAFLDVMNANTATRVGAGSVARFLGKTKLRVFAKLGVRGYQPYERLGLWLRRELRPLVSEILLSERCLDRGVFNPLVVRQVVENHFAARRNHTYLILAMMIFELGRRQFVDRAGTADEPGPQPGNLVLR